MSQALWKGILMHLQKISTHISLRRPLPLIWVETPSFFLILILPTDHPSPRFNQLLWRLALSTSSQKCIKPFLQEYGWNTWSPFRPFLWNWHGKIGIKLFIKQQNSDHRTERIRMLERQYCLSYEICLSMMKLKALWVKEKMLVTSIFSFSLNVFNIPLSPRLI